MSGGKGFHKMIREERRTKEAPGEVGHTKRQSGEMKRMKKDWGEVSGTKRQ